MGGLGAPLAMAATCLLFLAILAHLPEVSAEPVLLDENLALDLYADLCCGVTSMAFVDEDTLLVLQKNGDVRLVRGGTVQDDPILTLSVNPVGEAGLLGIASVDSAVYLYYTEADEDGRQLGNRIYRYDWNGAALENPVLLKELPSNLYHNGGAMIAGPNDQIYAVIGDTGRYGPLQNKKLEDLFPPGITDYMDTSVILRIDPPGPYYAVGIRNSFGLAVDPITGSIWDTENGDDDFDEINIVPDKFNSGWQAIMGPATEQERAGLIGYEDYTYQDPKFSWERVVAPAGIGFASFEETDEYDGSVFVGDCNNGRLYRFQLNSERDGFVFDTPELRDGLADRGDPLGEIIIGTGFACVTDIKTGPDGFLYLASYGSGNVYRILPAEAAGARTPPTGGCLIATAAYGSELAPQVQLLREIRDGSLIYTESGMYFMSAFNSVYYHFSPAAADAIRDNEALRSAARVLLAPMLYSLSVTGLADERSEFQTLGLGIMVILLNLCMYIAAPAAAAWQAGRLARRLRPAFRKIDK